jgi:hypothetical protein
VTKTTSGEGIGDRVLLRYFVTRYAGAAASMVVFLALAGLAEGFGIATLLPTLRQGRLC